MASPGQILDDVSRICAALERSIEPRTLPPELRDLPIGELSHLHEAIEFLRRPILMARVSTSRKSPEFVMGVLTDFRSRLDRVLADSSIYRVSSQVPFKIPPISRISIDGVRSALSKKNMNIEDAIELLEDILNSEDIYSIGIPLEANDRSASLNSLQKILPGGQVLAPAQFIVEAGRVQVIHQPAKASLKDEENIKSAGEEIGNVGERILEELSRSNCDRRLIEGFEELKTRISSGEDIIRAGLTNITCTHLFERFKDELPSALYGMMQGHSVAVSMYVGQFPEWRRFAEQAAEANLDQEYAPTIAATARELALQFQKHPELADPEVPKILLLIDELLGDKSKTGKRALFAALRTIENLFQATFSFAQDYLRQTAEKTIKKLSTLTARIIVVTIAGAILFGPVASSLPEVMWVRQATKIVEQELKARGIEF